MSIADVFRRVGAPLKNGRWSWGSIRAKDGAVFLRVWQDDFKRINDVGHVKVLGDPALSRKLDSLGRVERVMHVDRVRNGARCYLIMCWAKDVNAAPREVKSYNDERIFPAGTVLETNNEVWVEMKEGVLPSQVALARDGDEDDVSDLL